MNILPEIIKSPTEIPNFGRDNLAELFSDYGFRKGVEVGVLDGTYSETLLKANPNLTLYGVDPYVPHRGYRDYTRTATFNKALESAEQKMAPYADRYRFIRKYSMEAVKDFEDRSLDFVYIDGDHSFQSVTNDIAEWSKKVRKGGIIAGHDYFKHKGPSNIKVYEAINAYCEAYKIPWYILGSKAIIPGEVRDKARSFMWIQQ